MGDAVEAVFISTGSEDNTTCSVQDLRTGTDLMRYKGGGCAQHHGLEMIGLNYLFAANATKPLIHVWPINKQEQLSGIRYVVPGRVNALAITPDGAYLVAAIQENIYLWHLNTGRMLNTISKHYQAVTCLRFTDNGEHFISGGKDGAVLVWDLTFACAPLDTGSGGQDSNEPLYSFNDHGLAVTDLYTGIGGIRSYLYTVSLDRCCKVYDLCGGHLLLSVVFPVALHSVVVNKLETSVYVGSGEGKVYVFHMENTPRMTEYHLEEEEEQAFVGHTAGKAITCLALNLSATALVSGGEDNQVCVWDVGSRQLIKSIPQNGAVSNLRIRLVSSRIFQPEHKQPEMFVDSLKRMISPRDENDHIELLMTEEYHKGRQSPELDFTLSVPGTDDELVLKFLSLYMKNGEEDDEEAAEDEAEAEEDESAEEEVESGEEEVESDEEEVQSGEEEAMEADDSDDIPDEDISLEEFQEAVVEAALGDDDDDQPAITNGRTTKVNVKKLLEENARLKEESKRMFELMFKYISTNGTTPATTTKQNADATTKTKRKKARKN